MFLGYFLKSFYALNLFVVRLNLKKTMISNISDRLLFDRRTKIVNNKLNSPVFYLFHPCKRVKLTTVAIILLLFLFFCITMCIPKLSSEMSGLSGDGISLQERKLVKQFQKELHEYIQSQTHVPNKGNCLILSAPNSNRHCPYFHFSSAFSRSIIIKMSHTKFAANFWSH